MAADGNQVIGIDVTFGAYPVWYERPEMGIFNATVVRSGATLRKRLYRDISLASLNRLIRAASSIRGCEWKRLPGGGWQKVEPNGDTVTWTL